MDFSKNRGRREDSREFRGERWVDPHREMPRRERNESMVSKFRTLSPAFRRAMPLTRGLNDFAVERVNERRRKKKEEKEIVI